MTLSDLAVRRPVFAAVAAIILCVVGLASFTALPVRELPSVDPPVVSIQTVYRGASAEVVEERITQVIESQVAGIQGIDRVSSSSRDGQSRISISFTRESYIIAIDKFIEINSVISRFSLSIRGKHENGEFIRGESIKIIKVKLFKICNHSIETITRVTLLCKTRRVIL